MEVLATKDLSQPCSWLALSASGLIVTVPGAQEAWLLDSKCRRRFAKRLTDPEFLAIAALERDTGCMSFAMMADAVFDHLTA